MQASLLLALGGQDVMLLADRALFWPGPDRLLIADLHLGKGETLRRGGIAVPRGGTGSDLQRLDALLARTGARELCVLGDFLHGPVDVGAWQAQWRAWRERHAGVRVVVIAGNHDRHLHRVAADWGITLLDELQEGPFVLRHVPEWDQRHVIAGHVHPRIRFPGLRGRWPAFWLQPGLTVLPAFSAFTGGFEPEPRREDAYVACLDGVVVRLPGAALLRSGLTR
jgi:DNA ligase-associated metallophosphoesterase